MADGDSDGNDPVENEERPQPARKREAVRNRAGEDEPMGGDLGERLGDLDEALETFDYPTTTDDLVEAVGDYVVETRGGEESLEAVLAPTDDQTFESADDVRSRILGLIHR